MGKNKNKKTNAFNLEGFENFFKDVNKTVSDQNFLNEQVKKEVKNFKDLKSNQVDFSNKNKVIDLEIKKEFAQLQRQVDLENKNNSLNNSIISNSSVNSELDKGFVDNNSSRNSFSSNNSNSSINSNESKNPNKDFIVFLEGLKERAENPRIHIITENNIDDTIQRAGKVVSNRSRNDSFISAHSEINSRSNSVSSNNSDLNNAKLYIDPKDLVDSKYTEKIDGLIGVLKGENVDNNLKEFFNNLEKEINHKDTKINDKKQIYQLLSDINPKKELSEIKNVFGRNIIIDSKGYLSSIEYKKATSESISTKDLEKFNEKHEKEHEKDIKNLQEKAIKLQLVCLKDIFNETGKEIKKAIDADTLIKPDDKKHAKENVDEYLYSARQNIKESFSDQHKAVSGGKPTSKYKEGDSLDKKLENTLSLINDPSTISSVFSSLDENLKKIAINDNIFKKVQEKASHFERLQKEGLQKEEGLGCFKDGLNAIEKATENLKVKNDLKLDLKNSFYALFEKNAGDRAKGNFLKATASLFNELNSEQRLKLKTDLQKVFSNDNAIDFVSSKENFHLKVAQEMIEGKHGFKGSDGIVYINELAMDLSKELEKRDKGHYFPNNELTTINYDNSFKKPEFNSKISSLNKKIAESIFESIEYQGAEKDLKSLAKGSLFSASIIKESDLKVLPNPDFINDDVGYSRITEKAEGYKATINASSTNAYKALDFHKNEILDNIYKDSSRSLDEKQLHIEKFGKALGVDGFGKQQLDNLKSVKEDRSTILDSKDNSDLKKTNFFANMFSGKNGKIEGLTKETDLLLQKVIDNKGGIKVTDLDKIFDNPLIKKNPDVLEKLSGKLSSNNEWKCGKDILDAISNKKEMLETINSMQLPEKEHWYSSSKSMDSLKDSLDKLVSDVVSGENIGTSIHNLKIDQVLKNNPKILESVCKSLSELGEKKDGDQGKALKDLVIDLYSGSKDLGMQMKGSSLQSENLKLQMEGLRNEIREMSNSKQNSSNFSVVKGANIDISKDLSKEFSQKLGSMLNVLSGGSKDDSNIRPSNTPSLDSNKSNNNENRR